MKQVYFAALAGNLGMLSAGQLYNWAPMLNKLISNGDPEYPVRNLTLNEANWIIFLLMPGASVGAIICALIVNIIGRKNTILFAAVSFLIGWIMVIFATSLWELYISRFISGIGVGLAYTSTPIYLGEIAPPKIRGTLTTMMGVAVNISIIIPYMIDLSVQNFAFVSLTVPYLFVITFIWVPESPYYLIRKNAQQKAIDSLVKLRGTKDVYKEVESIEQSVKSDLANNSGLRDLLIPSNRRTITVMMCLSILQQAVNSFNVSVYLIVYLIVNSEMCFEHTINVTTVISAIQLISTIICMLVTDRFGRKSLMIISCIGSACTIGLFATFFSLLYDDVDISKFECLLVVGFFLYIFMYNLGLFPLLHTLSGEVFPMNIKAFGGMMVLLTTTVTNFVLQKYTINLGKYYYLLWIQCMRFSWCFLHLSLFTRNQRQDAGRNTEEQVNSKNARSVNNNKQ